MILDGQVTNNHVQDPCQNQGVDESSLSRHNKTYSFRTMYYIEHCIIMPEETEKTRAGVSFNQKREITF
jgi:hypothetical protein